MGGTTGIAVAENGDVYIVSDIEDGIVKITLQ
jgi:Ethanolamine utilization protein EutJ (predicted chaperonin)